MFEIAESITQQGYYVLIFDFSGCGNSEGSLLTATLDDWFGELGCVSDYFKTNCSLNKVHYLGLRLGSLIAGVYCSKTDYSGKTIMLEPVINPEEYFKKVLKSKLFKELLTQGNISSKRNELIEELKDNKSLDFDGHEIGASFYRSIVEHKGDFNKVKAVNTFVVNASITGKTSKEYQRLIEAGQLKRENFATIKLEPFWDRIESSPDICELKELIINWL